MSRNSHMMLEDMRLRGGHWFPEHVHDDHHQLVWAAHGVVAVAVDDQRWVLPTTRALWMPAGTVHRTGAMGGAVLRAIFCPAERVEGSDWGRPRLVRVGPLLRELLGHLLREELASDARARAEAVLFDLLEPVSAPPINVPVPKDSRARRVARAIIAKPSDGRTLAELARWAGASERTLARIWVAETGLSFGQWRTQARLRAALLRLANGATLERTAEQVGYCSASAFAAAFRRSVGLSPGRYFA